MTKLSEFQDKIQERLASCSHFILPPLSSPSFPFPKMVGRVIYPIGYGADPTGAQDSSDAILLFSYRLGFICCHMLPILEVKGGTLRASRVFPGDRHLVELVASNSRIFYEDLTFRDILFDSSFRGGGIFVTDSARIRITDCYFLHFTTQGIKIKGGHETYISNSFLGQRSTVGGDPQEIKFSRTGIDISSNDNAITNVVIFSAGIGISLNGANMITGVHCYNKATWFGGIGILVKSHLTRIDNCYLDYTGIVIEDPVHVHVTNSLFLGDANIVLRSVHGKISGLNIVNSMFSGTAKFNFPIVKLKGEFHDIDQVVVDHNNASEMMLKSTTGMSKVYANGTRWVADFSRVL
ncbi:unnamed protein product [Arabidopsis lyrata]|nr:unnamed protein product [Arabidopsis lyrata]